MTFTADFALLLKSSVVYSASTGTDDYGNKTWGLPITIEAHIDRTTVADATGMVGTVSRTGTLYFGTELVTPVPGGRVVLPDGQTVYLTSVAQYLDNDGVAHHHECQWEQQDPGDA